MDVIKIACEDGQEERNLSSMGPKARAAGVDVPELQSVGSLAGHSLICQNALRGQSVAALLASHPKKLCEIVGRVTQWLVEWNRSTMVLYQPDHRFLKEEIYASASLLAPGLEQGEEYRIWLEGRCASGTGRIPLVAAHNDLTMWNLLLDEHGQLGVVDWEAASERSLPLVDLFYAITDAVVMAKCWDRERAFREVFTPRGALQDLLIPSLIRLEQAVQMPRELVDLCLHACFLHHAANEQRRAAPGDSRPFLHIVQWLALNRTAVEEWMAALT